VVLLVAVPIFVAAREDGAYWVTASGVLGLLVILALSILLAARPARPARAAAVAAVALIGLGVWSAASPLWDGIPSEAWRGLNRSAVAAAALLLGAAIAARSQRWRNLVFAGVLAATTLQAGEILLRAGLDRMPAAWLEGRLLEGPIGYHNAQAGFLALGLPLGVWATAAGAPRLRVLAGFSVGLLASALLLCQSRGALIALAFALALQVMWARTLRVVVGGATVAASLIVLSVPLQNVDAALIDGTAIAQATRLREYALSALLVSGVAAATGAFTFSSKRARRSLVVVGLAAAIAGTAALIESKPRLRVSANLISQLASDAPPETAAGATRLSALSLNGRRDAWRVALGMNADEPITGAGQGVFARRWAVDRRLERLYILQPHSLELELLAELGVVGLALFALFAGSAALGIVKNPCRLVAAAGLGVAAVLLFQSAVDWTWHFSGLVVPAMLVVGATAGGRPVASPRRWTRACALLPMPLVAASLVAPALAERQVAKARAAPASDPGSAWYHAVAAQELDPWNPEAVALEALALERAARFHRAAKRYERAAELSQRPWLQRYRQARALKSAGLSAEAAAACAEAFAANPAEPRLRRGPCLEE
jgi:tetratricopeptide (TPR) repeat protein